MSKITLDNLSDNLKAYLEGLGLSEAQVQELIDKFEDEKIGDISQLSTQEKGSLVEAINDNKTSILSIKNLENEEVEVRKIETEENFIALEDTKNGYFTDIKLEGKTLVNLVEPLYSSNSTGLQSNKFLYIPSSKKVTVYISTSLDTTYMKGAIYSRIGNEDNSSFIPYSNENINKPFLVDFNEDAQSIVKHYFIYVNNHDGTSYIDYDKSKVKIIAIEGDHSDKPMSYFEGLKSVGQDVNEISVLTCNGGSLSNFTFASNVAVDSQGILVPNPDYSVTDFVQVMPNRTYIRLGDNDMCAYDYNKKPLGRMIVANGKGVFDIPNNVYYVRFNVNNSIVNEFRFNLGRNLIDLSIKNKQDKKRILYYNTDTQNWEKPVLRKWDSIEKHSDGKYYYHVRSCEVTLNGSENWVRRSMANENSTMGFGLPRNYIDESSDTRATSCVCDKFMPHVTINTSGWNTDDENIYINDYVHIRINKSKLQAQTVEGFKTWLQANPTTVVYQLAQEKVYECTNLDLISYQDETNYIVNTGAITPKSSFNVHSDISNVVTLLQKNVTDGNTHEHEYQKHKLSHHNGYSFEVKNSDLNEITKTGWYSVFNCENSPISSDLWGILEVVTHAHGENFVLQRFTQLLGSTIPPSYYRLKIGEGIWLEWQKITTNSTASVSDYSLRDNNLTENEILTESIISLEDRIIELEDEVDTLKQQLAILTSRLDNLENK